MKNIRWFVWVILAVTMISVVMFATINRAAPTETHTVEGVQIYLEPDTLSSSGARFFIENATDELIETGARYIIEKKGVGGWKMLNFDMAVWPAICFVVTAQSYRSFDVDWSSVYGNLPTGTYRLIKPITVSGIEFNIAVEFEVRQQDV